MSRARDMANLGAQAGSGFDASDLTTGTLGNTVQDNITRLGTVTTGTFEGTLNSSTTLPGYSVVYADSSTLSGSSTQTYTFSSSGSYVYDGFYDVGLELTITSANASKGSKILVWFNHGIGLGNSGGSNPRSQAHYRLIRTAPSSSVVSSGYWVGHQGDGVPYPRMAISGHALSDRTESGDYTYKVQVSISNGGAADVVYYNWYQNSKQTISALVLK